MGGTDFHDQWAAWAAAELPNDAAAQDVAISAAAAASARGADTAAATVAALAAGRSFQSYSAAIPPPSQAPHAAHDLAAPPAFPNPEPVSPVRGSAINRFLHNPVALVSTAAGLSLASLAAVAIVLIGVGTPVRAVNRVSASPSQSTDLPSGTEADGVIAQEIALDSASLPSGWSLTDEGFGSPEELTGATTCAGATLTRPTLVFYRRFNYLVSQGNTQGVLDVAIVADRTSADSEQDMATIGSDTYIPCLSSRAQDSVTGTGSQPTGVSVVRRMGPAAQVALPSMVHEISTPYTFAGYPKVMHETDVHVANGRVTAHMRVRRCCPEAEDASWKAMIQHLSSVLTSNLQRFAKP